MNISVIIQKLQNFDKDYKKYIEYRFIGLFPISLNATTVSYEGSQILKATASFNFERYIAGESYSINYAKGDDGNKAPNSLPELSRGPKYMNSNLDSGTLDTGIIPAIIKQYLIILPLLLTDI